MVPHLIQHASVEENLGKLSSRLRRYFFKTHNYFLRKLFVVITLWLVAGCGGVPVVTPSATVRPAATGTRFPSATVTETMMPSLTATATATPTSLPTLTQTPSLAPTATEEPSAERIPIIEYHYSNFRLSDQVMMTAEWYKGQIQWLVDNGFTTLSASDLLDYLNGKKFPVKSVILSFDIGTARRTDFETVIIPTLKQAHFKAFFFVLVNDTVITDTCGKDDRYCWDELRQWQSDGIISVESHGVFHPDYATLKPDEIKWDSGRSLKEITDKMGTAPLGFAYPFDSVPDQALKIIESVGYKFAVSGFSRKDRSIHPQDPDRYNLPRVYPYSNPAIYPVISGSNGATFEQLVMGSIQAQVPSASIAAAGSTTTPIPDDTSLVGFCRRNPPVNNSAWVDMLNKRAFNTQVSQAAQSQLPLGVTVRPTCNFIAGNAPRAIVLHYTDGGLEGAVATFQLPNNTSVHYIIGRDGTVVQMVQEGMGAFHVSCFAGVGYCVPTCPICELNGKFVEPYLQSIGIELVNDGHVDPKFFNGNIYEDYMVAFGYRFWEDYPPAQIESLKVLVQDIRTRWNIPWDMVMGHYRINKKDDPGPALNLFWPRYGYPSRPPIFDITQP